MQRYPNQFVKCMEPLGQILHEFVTEMNLLLPQATNVPE
jgi:hypothetical protein